MLYGEKLREICNKLGINPEKLDDRLFSTLLDEICNCCGNGGGSVEPITDLTGTTWYFKNNIDLDSLPVSSGQDNKYSIDFNLPMNSKQPYTLIYNDSDLMYGTSGSTSMAYRTSTGWRNAFFRVIDITGGTDTTNPDLIAWLQANATQVFAE